MRDSLISYALGALALLLAGPVAWLLTSGIVDASGGHGTTLLHASAVAPALLRGLAAIAIAAAVGTLTARLSGLRGGLWNAGVVLAWAASGLGTVDQVLRARESADGLLTTLAIEAAILAIPITLTAFACWRLSKEQHSHQESWTDLPGTGKATAIVLGVIASAVATGVVAHLAMINNLKGQAIGASALGALTGAVVVALLAPRAPAWCAVGGAMLAGALGPVAAQFITPQGQVSAAIHAWQLLGPARITAMDFAAGSLMGAPIGLWIAGGLLERRSTTEARLAG